MPPTLYLVTIPKHYISLEVRDGSMYLCDNHTKQELEIQNSARLSQKVERIWKVTRIKEYHRPHVVHTQFHAEICFGRTEVKRVIKMSDGGIKVHPYGTINTDNQEELQEIAFEIMKVTGKGNV
jgi:hypothetical protein